MEGTSLMRAIAILTVIFGVSATRNNNFPK